MASFLTERVEVNVRSVRGFLLTSAVLGLSVGPAQADGERWRDRAGSGFPQTGAVALQTNRAVEPFGSPRSAPSHNSALSSERMSAAAGHYARARSLLIEALAEFQRGERIARPDLILDADQWRKAITSRKDDLDRLLNPQPRVSRAGARFVENSRLLRTPREQNAPQPTPPPSGSGRAQLRGSSLGGITPADAIPAPQPERASKLRLSEAEAAKEGGNERAVSAPEKRKSRRSSEEAAAKKTSSSSSLERPSGVTTTTTTAPAVEAVQSRGASPELVSEVSPPSNSEALGPASLSGERGATQAKQNQAAENRSKGEAGLGTESTKEEQRTVETSVVPPGLESAGGEPTSSNQESAEASKVPTEEDPAVTTKIEDALIQERLKRLAEDYIAEEQRTKRE